MAYAENINPLISLLFYINTCIYVFKCECVLVNADAFSSVSQYVLQYVSQQVSHPVSLYESQQDSQQKSRHVTQPTWKKNTPSTYVPRPPQDISNKAWWSRIRASYARTTSSRGDSSLTWYPSCPLTSSISSPALTVITTSLGLYLWGLIGFCGKCC